MKKGTPRYQWTEGQIAELVARYVVDGPKKLSKEMRVSYYVLNSKAKRLGLPNLQELRGRVSYDTEYFKKWTPNMAYILGFLFADGNVSKGLGSVVVNLVATDRAVLDFIHDELKCLLPIRINPGKGSDKPQAYLGVHSKSIAKQLVALGMKPRKTYNDDPFPDVPDEMIPHFIRGYFDGDGCASRSINFSGSPKFLTGVRDALVRLAGMVESPVHLIDGKTTIYALVEWSAKKDVEKFRKYVYPNETCFCLLRKRQKLDESLAKRIRDRQLVYWTPEQEQMIRDEYAVVGPRRLGAILGIKPHLVSYKARKLGIESVTSTQRAAIRSRNLLSL